MAFFVAGFLSVITVSGIRIKPDPVEPSMPDVDTQLENLKKRYANPAIVVDSSYMPDSEMKIDDIKNSGTYINQHQEKYNIKKRVPSTPVEAFPVDFFMPDFMPDAEPQGENINTKGKTLKSKEAKVPQWRQWRQLEETVDEAIAATDEAGPEEKQVKWASFYGDVASKVLKPVGSNGKHNLMKMCSKTQEACLNQACDDSGPFHVNVEHITSAIARVLQRIEANQHRQPASMLKLKGKNCNADSGCAAAAKENLALLFKLKRWKNMGVLSDPDFNFKYKQLPLSLTPISAARLELQFKQEACGVESCCENWVCPAVE